MACFLQGKRIRLLTLRVSSRPEKGVGIVKNVIRRVAMLSEHASPIAVLGSEDSGGQNVYVAEVSRQVAALGYKVDVFTRLASDDAPQVVEWADGVRVVNLRAGPAQFLKKDEIWPYMPRFRDSFLRFTRQQRLRYDLIHSNFWMSGWVAAELRAILDLPVVHIFHALGKVKRLYQGRADTSPDERVTVEYQIINEVDRIIAQCPAEVDELRELYDADPDKIRIIPSAVNTEIFRPVPRERARRFLDLPLDEKVIVYVGRVLPRKGIDNAIRGFAQMVHRTGMAARMLVVGGETEDADPTLTPEIGRLSQLAAELGVGEMVHFTGKRPQRLLKLYYSAADVSVTTPWYEPFGLTPLESMACGTPVIGSTVGGIQFTVVDGETGFQVAARDPAALADRMARILSDPALRARMAKKARERVLKYFTWGRVAQRVAGLYDEVLSGVREPVLLENRRPHLVPITSDGSPIYLQ